MAKAHFVHIKGTHVYSMTREIEYNHSVFLTIPIALSFILELGMTARISFQLLLPPISAMGLRGMCFRDWFQLDFQDFQLNTIASTWLPMNDANCQWLKNELQVILRFMDFGLVEDEALHKKSTEPRYATISNPKLKSITIFSNKTMWF